MTYYRPGDKGRIVIKKRNKSLHETDEMLNDYRELQRKMLKKYTAQLERN
jgi:hypothetical protein